MREVLGRGGDYIASAGAAVNKGAGAIGSAVSSTGRALGSAIIKVGLPLGSAAAGWFATPLIADPLLEWISTNVSTDRFDIRTAFGPGRNGAAMLAGIIFAAIAGMAFGIGGTLGLVLGLFFALGALRLVWAGWNNESLAG